MLLCDGQIGANQAPQAPQSGRNVIHYWLSFFSLHWEHSMSAHFEMAIDHCVIFDLRLSKASEEGTRFCHLRTNDCRSTMTTLFKCLAITIGNKNQSVWSRSKWNDMWLFHLLPGILAPTSASILCGNPPAGYELRGAKYYKVSLTK